MARYRTAFKTSGAGTAARPIASIYGIANVSGWLVEAHILNTTAVAAEFTLSRLTAAGTPGTGKTETKEWINSVAASLTAFDTHSADATVGDPIDYVQLPAAIGGGVILTFGNRGIEIPSGTANGIGFVPVGTGQICIVKFVWDE